MAFHAIKNLQAAARVHSVQVFYVCDGLTGGTVPRVGSCPFLCCGVCEWMVYIEGCKLNCPSDLRCSGISGTVTSANRSVEFNSHERCSLLEVTLDASDVALILTVHYPSYCWLRLSNSWKCCIAYEQLLFKICSTPTPTSNRCRLESFTSCTFCGRLAASDFVMKFIEARAVRWPKSGSSTGLLHYYTFGLEAANDAQNVNADSSQKR